MEKYGESGMTLKKSWRFIFAWSVITGILSYVEPSGTNVQMDESFLAMICKSKGNVQAVKIQE